MLATSTNASPGVFARPQDLLYSAFGLHIRSELLLPEFEQMVEAGDRCDVTVRVREDEQWPLSDRKQANPWTVEKDEARFWYPDVGGFRVIGGSKIIINPEPFVDEGLLRLYVEGMMFAALLYQRNYFVLHASVIRIGDSCVAMLGNVGAGKSSIAAALYARGHAVVSDDNAAISFIGQAPTVTPAFPYLKVFAGIAESLGYPSDALQRMHSSQPKFASNVAESFPRGPVPLASIYLLSRNAASQATPLNATETTIELIRNSVPTRWNLPGTADHLQQSTSLARCVPAFRVRTFTTLEELPMLAEAIERHHLGAARA